MNAETRYSLLVLDFETVLGRAGLSQEQRSGLQANLRYHRRVLAAIRAHRAVLASMARQQAAGGRPRRAGHWRAHAPR